MELKDFVKKVIVDLDQAVSEANIATNREVRFKGVKEQRTAVEFDIAVTVESSDSNGIGGGIKVWGIAEAGAKGVVESRNSSVSRVSFGIDIGEYTKEERAEHTRMINQVNRPQNYI